MRRIRSRIFICLCLIAASLNNVSQAQEYVVEADEVSAAQFQDNLSAKFRSWNTYLIKKSIITPDLQTTRVRVDLGAGELVFSGNHQPLTDNNSRLVALSEAGRLELAFPRLLYLNGNSSRLTIGDNFILGETISNGEIYLLEQLQNLDPSAPANMLIRYKKSDVIQPQGIFCDVKPNSEMTRRLPPPGSDKKTGNIAAVCKTIEIAALASYSTFVQHASSLSTTAAYIASIYNLSDADYKGQFNVDLSYKITELVVSTAATANPWIITDDIYGNLSSFNSAAAAYFKSPNDLSSVWFNTKNFTGGVVGLAYMGFTCTPAGDAAIREFNASAQSMRCLLSHEHGHNFSMDHDAAGAPFIMAPAVNFSNVDFSISSINALESWFTNGRANCITDCNSEPCESTPPILLSIASDISTGQIRVIWESEPNIDGYIIRWKVRNSSEFIADTLDPETTEYNILLDCNAGKNYRVELAKICSNGMVGQFRGAEILNQSIPTVVANKPTSFCIGGDVTLSSSLATGNQWYKNNVIIPGATAKTLLVTTSGVYTTRTTTLAGCPVSSDPITVTVSAFPPKPLITVSGALVFCSGGKATLISSAITGNQWLRNGLPITGATAKTYVATISGVYSVRVTNAGNCSTVSDSKTITVNPVPLVPLVTAGGILKLCPGTSVLLTSNAAAGNQWFKDNVAITGATAKTYKAIAAGNYTVKVTNALGCSSISLITKVTYSDNPPIPLITTTTPLNFCSGGSVLLTSSALTGNQWYKDGLPITGAVAKTYKALLPGKYTVKVTNIGGCTALSAISTVVVYALPAVPTVTPAGPVSICTGTEILLTSVIATNYQWYKNAVIIPGATARTYRANAAGKYTVVVGNAYGCRSTSLPVTVTQLANPYKPIVKANGPLNFCAGKSVILTSNVATGNQWYKDGKLIIDSIGKTITVSTAGKYLLKVTNAAGCFTFSDTIPVTVNALPVVPRITSSGVLTFCEGKQITLTSNSATSNQWFKNDIAIAGANTNTLIVTSSGNYRVVVTNASGCSASSLVSAVTVNPMPQIPVVTAGAPLSICNGTKLLLSSSAATGNQWLKNGYAITGATSNTYEVTTAGTYSVKVIGTGGCFVVSQGLVVTVIPSPPKPILTRNGNTFSTSSAYPAYVWYKDNVAIAGAVTNTYQTTEAGNYRVAVTAANGCSTLSDEYVLSAVVGIHGVSALPSLRCYPNPAGDLINLQYPPAGVKKYIIRIYDGFGKLVITETMKGAVHQLSTSRLPAGVYQVILSSGETAGFF